MQARMENPAIVVPGAMQALLNLGKVSQDGSVPQVTHILVHLRASQINGCSYCVNMHSLELRHLRQSDERIFGVAAWRESPYFTEAERAALALTEAVTRLSDRADPVPDEIWNEASRHFDEAELGALILSIAMINVWNRLNAATRQPAAPLAA